MDENLLKTKELEEFFKVSRGTINNWRKKGLPFVKLEGSLRFDKKEVEEWLESKKEK